MASQVSFEIVGGPQATVAWRQGVNAQDALEATWNAINNTELLLHEALESADLFLQIA